MAELSKALIEERDKLLVELKAKTAEVESLRGQLAAAGAGRVVAPVHTFELNQGQLAELETSGVTNVNGRQVTTDQVRGMLSGGQANLPIRDASNPVTPATVVGRRGAAYGVDYVYPSVEPGRIDPAAAGQPGISGPPAGSGR